MQKKLENVTQKNFKKSLETVFEWTHMFELVDKDFRVAIKNMFKGLKKTMFKSLNMMTENQQIENLNKAMGIMKRAKCKFWS